jgi:hypothetical protein
MDVLDSIFIRLHISARETNSARSGQACSAAVPCLVGEAEFGFESYLSPEEGALPPRKLEKSQDDSS